VIQDDVSGTTGVPVAEVKETLEYLSQQFILKECATPARNTLETPTPSGKVTEGWYEKGEMWPK
jgi:hypothetical protein